MLATVKHGFPHIWIVNRCTFSAVCLQPNFNCPNFYQQQRHFSNNYFDKIRNNINDKVSNQSALNDYIKKMKANFDDIMKFPITNQLDIKQITENVTTSLKDIKKTPSSAIGIGTIVTLPVLMPPTLCLLAGVFYPGLVKFQVAYTACAVIYFFGLKAGKRHEVASMGDQMTRDLVPACLGFTGLLFLSVPPLSTLLVSGAMGTSIYSDFLNPPFSGWYMAACFLFSGLAVLSLGGTFLLYWTLPTRKRKHSPKNAN